jgi:hypothetical protein
MGQRVDYRLMEECGPPPSPVDRARGEEIWFDYLADTGDGWNPTYAIATLVAAPALEVEVAERLEGGQIRRLDRPEPRRLEHGQFLVLGGDEVYPVPSQRNYRERLVAPFETALPSSEPPRDLFAIPGNHDWYDGLVSFSRRFTQSRRIGGWQTRQTRSYFALRLPQRWWLWAVDVQLESDIDPTQREYFDTIADQVQPGDRLILVSAEPDWLYRDNATRDEAMEDSNLAYLEERIIKRTGATVYLWLAGDLHHYRRHEKGGDPRFQRITSGGGGAFLHPTHAPLFGAATTVSREIVRVGGDEYTPKCSFPSPSASFRLSFLNFLFLVKNWKFGLLTGLGYTAVTWGYPWTGRPLPDELVGQPARLLVMLLILAGFVLYTDRERPGFRWVGGLTHGAAHLTCALLLADLSARWMAGMGLVAPWGQVWSLVANFGAGAVVGPTLWGVYLFGALNLFGAQANEAFSALRIQDYKHFLRLHITREGLLEIFPIGIPRVPRTADARLRYLLIEGPIRIDPR